jgi:hypothetical protein
MLGFPEEGKQNKRGKARGLDQDRKKQSAAAESAFATALVTIAFDETSA